MRNLNRHEAYKELRLLRERLRKGGLKILGTELANGLLRYSVRGEHYVDEIKSMIRHNNLSIHDQNL